MGVEPRAILAWIARGLVVMMACAPVAAQARGAVGLHVIPFPGTPDASPESQIIFSSLTPSELPSVSVSGSLSGPHSGTLVSLPDGAGTAFQPDQPFMAGEQVSVGATLSSAAAGTAAGDPNSTSLGYSFTVATPARSGAASPVRAPVKHPTRQSGTSLASGGPTQRFHSEPGLRPPVVESPAGAGTALGDIFITANTPGTPRGLQNGPMILNSHGRLVWFQKVDGYATNLEVQSYQGRPVLTWFESLTGLGSQDVIMNSSYQTVATLRAGYGYAADLHDFQLTPRGTALMDAYVPVTSDLSSVGGTTGPVMDCVIQELDVKTGQVLWEWHALGHIPLTASYMGTPNGHAPYDFFHLNSIQELPDGNLLVSSRNTWAVYEIDRRTGDVLWSLGGRNSSFTMGTGTGFEWQHDAQLHPGNLLTVFDDASDGGSQEEVQSSAKVLALNTTAMTASLVSQYDHSPPLITPAEGSAQVLPNGDLFVGWGKQPELSEYNAAGRQLFSWTLPFGTFSYRAYRFPWAGQPPTRPSLSVVPQSNGSARVYASWNGATQVAAWRVLGGPRPGALHSMAGAPSAGFETTIVLRSEPPILAVQALDGSGRILRTSVAQHDPPHLAIFIPHSFVRVGSGHGTLPVGCFTGHDCEITAQIRLRSLVLAQSPLQLVRSGTGAQVRFGLSAAGQRLLRQAGSSHLKVRITINDIESGARANKTVTLIPYSNAGHVQSLPAAQSPTIQLAGATGFVSAAGRGAFLAACYGPQVCHARAVITAGGVVIGAVRRSALGADELGEIGFTLNSTGALMLRHASGNRLPAEVVVSNGADTASGEITLVRYT